MERLAALPVCSQALAGRSGRGETNTREAIMGVFRGRKLSFLFGGAIGAALAFFFDPDRGGGRRTRTRDMAKSRIRRAGQEAGRQARWRRGQLSGAVYEATHQVPAQPEVDDKTL